MAQATMTDTNDILNMLFPPRQSSGRRRYVPKARRSAAAQAAGAKSETAAPVPVCESQPVAVSLPEQFHRPDPDAPKPMGMRAYSEALAEEARARDERLRVVARQVGAAAQSITDFETFKSWRRDWFENVLMRAHCKEHKQPFIRSHILPTDSQKTHSDSQKV